MKNYLYALLFILGTNPINAQIREIVFRNGYNEVVQNMSEAVMMTIIETAEENKIEQTFDMNGKHLSTAQFTFVKNWNSIKKDSVSKWLKHGVQTIWENNYANKEKQNYYYGVKHGESNIYYSTGELFMQDYFFGGLLQNVYFYDKSGHKFLLFDKDMISVSAKKIDNINEFLNTYFRPVFDEINNEKEDVFIKLTVDVKGVAKDFCIFNSDNHNAHKKMAELIKKLPVFIPASIKGVPLETSILVRGFKKQPSQYNDSLFKSNNPNNPESNLPYERTLYYRDQQMRVRN